MVHQALLTPARAPTLSDPHGTRPLRSRLSAQTRASKLVISSAARAPNAADAPQARRPRATPRASATPRRLVPQRLLGVLGVAILTWGCGGSSRPPMPGTLAMTGRGDTPALPPLAAPGPDRSEPATGDADRHARDGASTHEPSLRAGEGPHGSAAESAAAPGAKRAPAAAPGPASAAAASLRCPPPVVRVTEIMSDPLLVADPVGEYVELVYLGPGRRALQGVEVVLPDGRKVPLGAQVVSPGQVIVVRGGVGAPLRLPNRAGRVEVRHQGDLVDVAQWTGRWPWPKHKAGRALCRRTPDVDGALGKAWRRCRARLRGVERGSPGAEPRACDWVQRRRRAVSARASAGGRGGSSRGGRSTSRKVLGELAPGSVTAGASASATGCPMPGADATGRSCRQRPAIVVRPARRGRAKRRRAKRAPRPSHATAPPTRARSGAGAGARVARVRVGPVHVARPPR